MAEMDLIVSVEPGPPISRVLRAGQAGSCCHRSRATTGALTFEAERTGDHDDLVVALALAVMVDPVKRRARHVPNPWV